MKRDACRAFTLVELLVVLSVIALLLAILSPTYSIVYKLVRQRRCANNLNQIHVALSSLGANSKLQGTLPLQVTSWREQILPYLSQDRQVLLCLEDSIAVAEGGTALVTLMEAEKKLAAYALRTYSGTTFLYDMMLKEGPACRRENVTDGGRNYDLSFEDQRTSTGAPTGDFSFKNPILTIQFSGDVVKVIVKGGAGGYHWDLIDPKGKVLMPDILKAAGSGVGASVTISGFGGRCSYGLNSVAAEISPAANRILGLEYPTDVARVAGLNETKDNWLIWMNSSGQYSFARHFNECNVLMANGAVIPMAPEEIHPADPRLVAKYWRP